MNMDSSMCASSGKAAHWEQVDWPKCERQVRKARFAPANTAKIAGGGPGARHAGMSP